MQANLPMGNNIVTGHGTPIATTDVTNKAYVDNALVAFFSTGDLKPTIKTVPDSGWLLLDDGTFGSASSGSSNSNNVANQALFTLIFNNLTDTFAPIFTSGGGATTRAAQTNASSAWAANCRMSLPKALGRAIGVAGAGSGLTTRTLGQTLGSETNVIGQTNLPNVNFAVSGQAGWPLDFNTGTFGLYAGGGTAQAITLIQPGAISATTTRTGNPLSNSLTASSGGGGAPLNGMPPILFVNAMIKL